MKALVHDGSGGVRLEEVKDARVERPTDALVAVRRAGVCGTDLHLLKHREKLPGGTILGHEFVGEVVDFGDRAEGLSVGDVVVANDYAACGVCRWCREGDHWHCGHRSFFGTGSTFGPSLPGGQAELVRVPFARTTLRRLPDDVDRDEAVLLGDVLATAYAAALRLHLTPGELAVVVGGGPVGQAAALVLQAFGAAPVVVVEPVPARRDLAGRLGSVVAEPDQAEEIVTRLSDKRRADVVLDAVGGDLGLDLALRLVRARGRVESVGVPTEATWSMPVGQAFAGEIRMGFSVGDFIRDSEALIRLQRSGLVRAPGLLSPVAGLDAGVRAYADMAERRILKAVIDVTGTSRRS